MATTVQNIIDYEQLDGADIPVLEEAQQILESQIRVLEDSTVKRLMPDAIPAKKELLSRVQDELNRRHGLDGMTPLNP